MVKPTQNTFWDEQYDTDEYIYGVHPNKFLASIADRIPVGKTLCLAEGEGRNAVYLASLGHDVTAVDSSAVGMKKAKKLAQKNGVNIETVTADLNSLEIQPDSWDAIISIFCHLPEESRKALHRKVKSGLRSGGMYVLESFTPDQLKYKTGGPHTKELLYSLKDLEEELEELDWEHAEELERDVLEGLYHTGRAAVVQVIAYKS